MDMFACFCNSSPNNKILDWSKLKAIADNKIKKKKKKYVTENLKFVLWRVENTVGKGENAGYQQILLFPQFFRSFLVHNC